MIHEILVQAPAKINLHLAVGCRRPDGFHAIASIFQAVSLGDTVALSLRQGGGIELEGECGCPVEKNTAWRAATAFLAAAFPGSGSSPGLKIALTKRIPMGAGLGGGSSDAASTLTGLSALFPGAVDASTLRRIAAETGSDVPFFMDTACAAVTGRGERLAPLVPRTDYTLVIVDPGFSVSTKEAYGTLDEAREQGRASPCPDDASLDEELSRAVRSYGSGGPSAWSFRNDFFDALSPGLPGLQACRQDVLSAGASFAAMSGSGSAIFGAFDTVASAERAVRILSSNYAARMAFPLARLHDSI